MLGAMDWDLYWRWELHRREADPLDVRAWKRDSSRELRALFPGEVLLLDATAGLGDHTVNLAELGFRTEACDVSAVARGAATRALREAGIEVPWLDTRWEALGQVRPSHYDLIFHDAIHWIDDTADFAASARGLFEALRPGGALVFFYADARAPEADAGERVLQWDWEKLGGAQLAWQHDVAGRRVSLSLLNERGAGWIDQHHLYVITEPDGAARLESLTMRRVYRWDWHAIGPALRAVGFDAIRSHAFTNVKGHSYALNLAFRP